MGIHYSQVSSNISARKGCPHVLLSIVDMKYKIAIYGSGEDESSTIMEKTREMAIAVAKWSEDVILITGGCPGIPNAVVREAHTISGIEAWAFCSSVDLSQQKQQFPEVDINVYHKLFYIPDNLDALFHASETGLAQTDVHVRHKYRNVNSAATADAGIIISGRWGTLNEFTNLMDMGKVIGVYTGTGGIADELYPLQKKIHKKTTSTICYGDNPHKLVQEVLRELRERGETHKKKEHDTITNET
jgi:hypothetical protein